MKKNMFKTKEFEKFVKQKIADKKIVQMRAIVNESVSRLESMIQNCALKDAEMKCAMNAQVQHIRTAVNNVPPPDPLYAWSKKDWAISVLSDAQELLSMGQTAETNETINDAKRILMGKFKETENGFAIEVLKK